MAVISNKQPQGKFVFKKQNKIRWKKSPSPGDEVVSSSPFFVTGSWDDMVRIKHAIMGINWWAWLGKGLRPFNAPLYNFLKSYNKDSIKGKF